MTLKKCFNIKDYRKVAKSKLPAPFFHYIDGGSDDEYSLVRNTTAFDDYELMPEYLVDISTINTQTKLFSKTISMPLMLAPTGMSALFHHAKENAVASAAEKFGLPYALSTVATTNIEAIGEIMTAPKVFQIYVLKDRGLTRELVERCKAAKYDALCLTVDTPLAGNRERDYHTGMTMPPSFGLKSLIDIALHPAWVANFLMHKKPTLENIAHYVGEKSDGGGENIMSYINSQFDRTVTWADAEWLAKEWGGPMVIKGLQSPADARRAADIGATGIMISNHGGRQLDTTSAPIDCVKAIRDSVGGDLELIVDGGVRRTTHILKAIAAGANACSIGRPYLYGLAAGGQKGVEGVLSLFKEGLERDMSLLGCKSIADIKSRHLVRKN